MPVATFDTLKFANTLKAAGVPPAHAEAEAHALAEALQVNLKDLVTKDDLEGAKKELKQEVKDVEQRLAARIDVLAAEQKTTRAELKGETLLLKWMLGTVLAALLMLIGLMVRVLFLLGR